MKLRKEALRQRSKGRTRTSGDAKPNPTEPTVREIQLRAYEIYVSRGRIDSQDLEDWFQAERELTEKIRKQRAG